MGEPPSIEEIRAALVSAIERLYHEDRHLIDVDANERSITHRLAQYLEAAFPGWDVDCEYNRDQADPKRIDEVEGRLREHSHDEDASHDTKGRTVYPDIIVHRRGTHNNLLVVEVKKTSSNIPDDIDRLKVLALCEAARYQYRYGVVVKLGVGCDGRPQEPTFICPKASHGAA